MQKHREYWSHEPSLRTILKNELLSSKLTKEIFNVRTVISNEHVVIYRNNTK